MQNILTFLLLFLLIPTVVVAQTAGTVNRYAPVTNIGFATGTTSTNCNNVTLTLGTARGNATAWAVNDRVLIIQMQGGYPAIPNDANFGLVDGSANGTDGSGGNGVGNAGNFEFNTIGSVSGATINLTSPLQNIYDIAGQVQLIRVPVYAANLTLTGNITGAAWDGSSGGVIALLVTSTLDMSTFDINADAIGFRGGTAVNGGNTCDFAGYFANSTTNDGAEKGEGIAVWNNNFRRARGRWANGGGGGSRREGGGGGGGNGAIGGNGGGQVTTNCGSNIGNGSGIGGSALAPSNTRAYMGGGGGGGHGSGGPETPSNGGIGGGIVIIEANNITGGGRTISANGGNGGDQSIDNATSNTGAGGGGAGGSLYVRRTVALTGALNLNANGGRGGNNRQSNNDCSGPGGGGGGGVIRLNASFGTASRSGGAAGTRTTAGSGGSCGGSTVNATAGTATAVAIPTDLVLTTSPTCTATISDIASLCSATSTLGNNIFPAGNFGSVTGAGETVGTASEWTATGGFGAVTFQNASGLAPGYTYNFNTANSPGDGQYTLVTGVRGLYGGTWIVSNDNSGTSTGYMMVVNSSYSPSQFYFQTISGLCENTRYEFSTDLVNLDNRTLRTISNPNVANAGYGPACDRTVEPNCPQSVFSSTRGCTLGGNCGRFRVEPDVEFLINGAVIASSGPVPVSTNGGTTHGGWRRYGVTFRTQPGTTSVTLVLRNRAPGGGGNDVGVDNIAFRACGPSVNLVGNLPACGRITADVGSDYNTPIFQWQYSNNGSTWIDIATTTTDPVLVIPVNNPAIGNMTTFRVLLANSLGNLGTTSCRVLSQAASAGCDLTTLPIILAKFAAQKAGNSVIIGWSTSLETNNSYFVVERSANGVDFAPVARVQAVGNSQTLSNYQAFDHNPLPGTSYYRLRQVDTDGTWTVSKLVAIDFDGQETFVFKILPNPSQGRFRLAFGGLTAQAQVRFTIFNVLGQPVADGTASSLAEELDLSDLAKGVYLIRVEALGQFRTQRIVLE